MKPKPLRTSEAIFVPSLNLTESVHQRPFLWAFGGDTVDGMEWSAAHIPMEGLLFPFHTVIDDDIDDVSSTTCNSDFCLRIVRYKLAIARKKSELWNSCNCELKSVGSQENMFFVATVKKIFSWFVITTFFLVSNQLR